MNFQILKLLLKKKKIKIPICLCFAVPIPVPKGVGKRSNPVPVPKGAGDRDGDRVARVNTLARDGGQKKKSFLHIEYSKLFSLFFLFQKYNIFSQIRTQINIYKINPLFKEIRDFSVEIHTRKNQEFDCKITFQILELFLNTFFASIEQQS